jgi:cation diffusion facilitator CzcD-associated flavoprotein CzcO
MELNVWTDTNIIGNSTFDSKTHTWSVPVKRADGSERVLHPRHIILASGHSGEPRIPNFPGHETFKGDIHHSSTHPGGFKYRGKNAIVVGSGNSGHDIAMDFYQQGAKSVTMIQRSSTYVMSQSNGIRHFMGALYVENGPSTEDADLFGSGLPFPVFKILQQDTTYKIAKDDQEMLKKLEDAGFKLDYGYDGSGLFIKYLTDGGGYYIDVGCSELIGDGKIKIKQGKEISRLVEDGVVFEDGSKLEADVIVLATGFDNMRQTARKIFGDNIGNRLLDVWGFNEEGEIATMWQSKYIIYPTLIVESGHEGFWFTGGNLALSRNYSRFLALQIKAIELGLN